MKSSTPGWQRLERRVVVHALAVLLVLAPCLQATAQDSRGLTRVESEELFDENENYAIVVGVDKYEFVQGLSHAVDDALRLGDIFERQGYRVFMLTDYEASPRRILKAVDKAARLATNEGRSGRGNVVFAFSGHGYRDERGENYLFTGESDPDSLGATALSLTEVSAALARRGVRQRVLFVDACRNVPGAKNVGDARLGFSHDAEAEGEAVFYSTAAGRLSWEDAALGQGVFTHFLVEGLEGAAAAEDGVVTFDGLRRYVTSQVKRHVVDRFDAVQIPYVGGERSGEFVLARIEPAPPEPSASPESSPSFEPVTGRLTVEAKPADARVRIMNVLPRYEPGMQLALGKEYDVFVTHSDYEPFRESVPLREANQIVRVELAERKPPQVEPSAVYETFESATPNSEVFEENANSVRCVGNDPEACGALAYKYDTGDGIERNAARAMALYRHACEGGHVSSCTLIGAVRKANELVMVDEKEAVERLGFEPSEDMASRAIYYGCANGDLEKCHSLGFQYDTGDGIERNAKRAMALYRRACEGGIASSCTLVGAVREADGLVMVDEKEAIGRLGFEPPESMAARTIYFSCANGDLEKCVVLGLSYEEGDADLGLARDEERAVSLYGRSCELEQENACVMLGGVYLERNPAEAAVHFRRGCEHGDAMSCFGLGMIYEDGLGVAKDAREARQFFRRSCDGGFADACRIVQ